MDPVWREFWKTNYLLFGVEGRATIADTFCVVLPCTTKLVPQKEIAGKRVGGEGLEFPLHFSTFDIFSVPFVFFPPEDTKNHYFDTLNPFWLVLVLGVDV